MSLKPALKQFLGGLPLTAEAYWYMRQYGQPLTAHFSLEKLKNLLPDWRTQAEQAKPRLVQDKQVFIFASLRYWIEHAALLGVSLAGLGGRVTLSYLPYSEWQRPIDRFTLRRHNIYALDVLKRAEPLLHVLPLLTSRKAASLPQELAEAVRSVALKDTQYTLQVEDVDSNSELYRLRLERDVEAARAALAWLEADRPEVVVIPNGAILEFGALYQVARYLDLPVVTYEFGEQRQRIWLAQNAQVMRQETDDLWQARKDQPASDAQIEQVRLLFASRQRAAVWENFARRWQGVPSEGGERARAALQLDARPVVLLATNVIGDSLTLGRQVFSDTMTDWLARTVNYFARRSDAQLVVRIHPGELVTKGPSVADVVQRALSEIPENIRLVPADARINTYDLIEIADLGLVYTTTVGLEMALGGAPVIVVGNTHYRQKGFTLDPDSWESYYATLSKALASPQDFRLSQAQVKLAWNYAYRFFFEYPHTFPWHLLHIWKDLEEWPVARALSDEGQALFGKSFRYLLGEPIQW